MLYFLCGVTVYNCDYPIGFCFMHRANFRDVWAIWMAWRRCIPGVDILGFDLDILSFAFCPCLSDYTRAR